MTVWQLDGNTISNLILMILQIDDLIPMVMDMSIIANTSGIRILVTLQASPINYKIVIFSDTERRISEG
jgi:hypothetical protein